MLFQTKVGRCGILLTIFLLANAVPIFAQELNENNQAQVQTEEESEEVVEKAPPGEVYLKPHRLIETKNIQQTVLQRMVGILGLIVLLSIAFACSTNRRLIPWRLVVFALMLQSFLAVAVLKSQVGRYIFNGANNVIVKILSFSTDGARLIFGNLVGANVPVGIPQSLPESMARITSVSGWANVGANFAFAVLPTIIFFSALTAILYYFGILQWVVRGIARIMQGTLRTSGAESFSAAANIFLGQTEAPLLIRPFIKDMTDSEIMAVMTGGFATVSGGVLAAFVGMLSGDFPDIAGHLLAASVMSAPASLLFAKMMLPETGAPLTAKASDINIPKTDTNVFDAASRGTSDGLHLALNVGAMLIAFVAIISFANWILGGASGFLGWPGLSMDRLFAWIFSPLAFLLGVPWEDAQAIGNLLGLKTAINEFVAYLELSKLLHAGAIVHTKSVVIVTYALCGFANFSSIGVQIGGLSALAPSRRADFARIGFRAMVAGTLACMQTATIAGIIL